jgi:hypothetical protein
MIPGGTTEIVSRFIGYLEVVDDIARARLDYQDGVLPFRPEDYKASLPDSPYHPDIDDLNSAPTPPPLPVESEGLPVPRQHHAALKPLEEPDFDSAKAGGLPPFVRTNGTAGGGGGSVEVQHIKVHYGTDGDQLQAEIKQLNVLNDNDFLLVGNNTDVLSLHHIDIGEVVAKMVAAANDIVPEDLATTYSSETSLIEMTKSHDAATAAEGGVDGEFSVAPGRYVNGELQPAPETPPADSSDTPLHDYPHEVTTGIDPGQWAVLGANEGVNGGLIVDIGEASRTMLVRGDYFKTDAIIQTNSYVDDDKIETATGHTTNLLSGGNTAENIAEFSAEPAVYSDTTGLFAGFNWHVDIADGDYYNMSVLSQRNYLSDNDVIVQDSTLSHYDVLSGGNVQYNIANWFEGNFHYDAIIIGGSFHGLNFIFQNNILLDNDIVKQAGTDDASPDQSVEAGDNSLTNDASIINYGGQTFLPFGKGMSDLSDALARGDTTLDPSKFGDVIPGNGSDSLNVLYITGDYYDINMIWQVNVFADVDTAIQFLHDQEHSDTTTQSASTGGNSLTNEAIIVDVGATNTFVDGDVYGDTILIQADLVKSDDDQVIHADPNTLVPELVAFTTPSEEEEQVAPPPIAVTHDDTLGHVLS